MPDVGWSTAPGLAVAMLLQIVGEEVEKGLEQRPVRVEDEAPVGVAQQPDVLNVKYVAAGCRPGKRLSRQNMCVTDLGTKVGFLWGLSVPDLEVLDLRKTRRSRTGSGLGR